MTLTRRRNAFATGNRAMLKRIGESWRAMPDEQLYLMIAVK
jgi:hypothetical protein